MNRYLYNQVCKDLAKKMVFIGGPRQIGKTTLAKQIISERDGAYYNWDVGIHREEILKQTLRQAPMWAFGEIHKYHLWRNYLKGIYDVFGKEKAILGTGSARLDLYRRGGDSLQGRYHYLRMYPLSVAELQMTDQDAFSQLLRLGGFPEPFFGGNEIEAQRWSREYRQRLLEEDLRSLEQVKDMGRMEQLMLRLPALVGSPLSINGLREDLQVSHATVSHWLDIFVKLYAIFFVPPFGHQGLRAVKKEQKHYHLDWSLVSGGAQFENLVAVHLLKWVHYIVDTEGREMGLAYFRDTEGREVDFVVTENRKPLYAIECKIQQESTSKALVYFKRKFPECTAVQLSVIGDTFVTKDGVIHRTAIDFLKEWL